MSYKLIRELLQGWLHSGMDALSSIISNLSVEDMSQVRLVNKEWNMGVEHHMKLAHKCSFNKYNYGPYIINLGNIEVICPGRTLSQKISYVYNTGKSVSYKSSLLSFSVVIDGSYATTECSNHRFHKILRIIINYSNAFILNDITGEEIDDGIDNEIIRAYPRFKGVRSGDSDECIGKYGKLMCSNAELVNKFISSLRYGGDDIIYKDININIFHSFDEIRVTHNSDVVVKDLIKIASFLSFNIISVRLEPQAKARPIFNLRFP
jgi:hypothetical protein